MCMDSISLVCPEQRLLECVTERGCFGVLKLAFRSKTMSQPPPKPWERRIPGAVGAPLSYRLVKNVFKYCDYVI